MSENDKIKPKAERIARLEGSSSYRDLREGFGGRANITDQDIAAAVAMSRRKLDIADAKGEHDIDRDDLGPELLETYFASTQRHRRRMVYAYMRSFPPSEGDLRKESVRRMGATLGAQMMAGIEHSRAQQAEFAYIVGTRLETMRTEIAMAYRWYLGEMENALVEFREIVSAVVATRISIQMKDASARTRAEYNKIKAA